MARKLRLEFPGAIYHVINRGNYRSWIFRDVLTRKAFQTTLFEACERSSWRLHAFVIMSNHFHLALETPKGNLIAGMQWLQATFACRFNRYRGEHGHLFSGRYRSLLVERGTALGQLCHYIHLNPVRAGIVTPRSLGRYRASSYWYLRHPDRRPAFLHPETALAAAGGLTDSPAGRANYQSYLAWQAAEGPAGKSKAGVNLSRGWALGSDEFKATLVQEHNLAPEARALEASGAREVRELRWSAALEAALRALGKTRAEARDAKKSERWKVAVAAWLKCRTDASNPWLAAALHLGAPKAASRNVAALLRHAPARNPWWHKLTSLSET
jgi:REP element-mobilizing transposase RayT